MTEYRKILFPVDLSEVPARLVEHALALAGRFSAELHVLYVIRPVEYGRVYYAPGPPEVRAFESEATESARQRLDEFVAQNLAGYPELKTSIIRGHIRDEILKYIADQGVDLVVMGTRSRKGVDRVLFGSVAQRIVQMSPVPVMTVSPATEPQAAV